MAPAAAAAKVPCEGSKISQASAMTSDVWVDISDQLIASLLRHIVACFRIDNILQWYPCRCHFRCLILSSTPAWMTWKEEQFPGAWWMKERVLLLCGASYQMGRIIFRHTTMFSQGMCYGTNVYPLDLQQFNSHQSDSGLLIYFTHFHTMFCNGVPSIWRCKLVVYNGFLFWIWTCGVTFKEPFVDWVN